MNIVFQSGRTWHLLALCVAVLGALTFGGGAAQPGGLQPRMPMMQGGMMVSGEFNYLSHMIPHHEEAVSSALLILVRRSPKR